MGLGQRLTHSTASSIGLDSRQRSEPKEQGVSSLADWQPG